MRVDVHHHILPPFYMEALRQRGLDRRLGVRFPEWRAEASLALMDRLAVDKAVVSVSTPGVALARLTAPGADRGRDDEGRLLARRVNEWAAELAARHDGRFGAFASVPLPDLDGALAEVAHSLDTLRLDGVVLLASAGGRYLGDAAFEPLFDELDRRRALVFVHPTTPPGTPLPGLDVPVFAVEFVADTTRALANLILSGTLERHPGIRFVVAHAGGFAPYITERLHHAWERAPGARDRAPAGPVAYLRRLHYDTALSANPVTLAALLALVGPHHVVLGTDFPFADAATAAATRDGVASLGALSGAERDAVLGATASRLLAGDSPATA